MLSDSASVGDKRTTKQQKQQARATKIANRKVHNASTWPANFPVFDSFKQDFNYQQYITVEQRFKEHVLNKQMTSAERKTAMREFWRNDAQSHQPDESDESDTSESESEGVFLYCQGDANVAVKCSTHLKCAAGEACKCPEIPIFSTGGGRHACYGQCGDQLHGQCGDQHDSNEMHRICMQCKEKLSVAAPTPSADLATAKNLVNNGGANGGDSGVAAPEVASTVQSPSGNGIDQGEPTESPIGSVAAPTLSADLATAKNLVNNGGANGGDSGDAAPEVASTVQSPSGNGIDQGEPTESPIGSVAAPTLSADLATAKNLVNNGGANGGDSGDAAPEVASTVQSPSGNGIVSYPTQPNPTQPCGDNGGDNGGHH
jgi:hypothetical protein